MSDDLFTNANTSLEEMAANITSVSGKLDLLSVMAKKTQESFARWADIKIRLEALKKSSGDVGDQISKLEQEFESAGEELRAATKATEQLRNAQKSLDKVVKGASDQFKKYGDNLNKTYGYAQKWLPMFGGMAISLKGAKDSLVQYNASMFSLQRTYQVASGAGQNFSKTIQYVSANTKMSTNDFLNFAQSATKVWKGAQPNIQVFGELASTLQDKLGPSLKDTERGLNTVSALMQKMPALGQAFVTTANALRKAEEGGSKEEIAKYTAQANRLKQVMALRRQQGGIDRETAATAMQALTPVTKEQQKQIDTNRKLAGVSKNMQDMQLKAGQQLEPLLNGITGRLEDLTNVIKEMPLQIFKMVAAFKLARMAAGKIELSGINALSVKGIVKSFSAAKAAAATGAAGIGTAGTSAAVKAGGVGAAGVAAKAGMGNQVVAQQVAQQAASKVPLTTQGLAAKAGMKGMGKMAVIGGVISGGMEYSERVSQGESKTRAASAGVVKGGSAAGGALLGAKGGALAGAAIGSVVPVIGTAIGAAGGAIIGGIIGGIAGDKVGEIVTDTVWPEYNKATAEAKKLEEQTGKNKDTTLELAESIYAARENQRILTESTQQAYEAISMQVDIMREAGLINYGNVDDYYGKSIKQLQRMEDQAKTSFAEIVRGMSEMEGLSISEELADQIKGMDNVELEVFFKGKGYEDFISSVQKKMDSESVEQKDLRKQYGAATTDDERSEIQNKINTSLMIEDTLTKQLADAASARNTIMTAGVKVVEQTRAGINSQVDAISKYNGIYEERLALEKDLMESAQFGMGASVEMMQQQVDMAYRLINAEKERGMASEKALEIELSKAKVGEEQRNLTEDERKNVMGQLKGAKDIMQVQKIVNSLGIKSEASAMAISKHTQDQVESTNNILKQQKKIYDITKDVREGYLDALQAMSVGAGEFSKIIGTQDMGASQLMDAVDKYNVSGEKGILDTGRMGGQQDKRDTGRGVGTDLAGIISATAGGPTAQFESGSQAQAKLERLHGSRKATNDFYQNIRGEGRQSAVGTGNAMTDNWAGAIEEGSLNKDDFAKLNKETTFVAVRDAILDTQGMNIMRGAGAAFQGDGGVRLGEPGVTNGNSRNMFMGPNAGAAVLGSARVSTISDPSVLVGSGVAVSGGSTTRGTYPVPTTAAGTNPEDRKRVAEEALNIELSRVQVGEKNKRLSQSQIEDARKQLKAARSTAETQKVIADLGIKDSNSAKSILRYTAQRAMATAEMDKDRGKAWGGAEKYNEAVSRINPHAVSDDASGTTFRNQYVPLIGVGGVAESEAAQMAERRNAETVQNVPADQQIDSFLTRTKPVDPNVETASPEKEKPVGGNVGSFWKATGDVKRIERMDHFKEELRREEEELKNIAVATDKHGYDHTSTKGRDTEKALRDRRRAQEARVQEAREKYERAQESSSSVVTDQGREARDASIKEKEAREAMQLADEAHSSYDFMSEAELKDLYDSGNRTDWKAAVKKRKKDTAGLTLTQLEERDEEAAKRYAAKNKTQSEYSTARSEADKSLNAVRIQSNMEKGIDAVSRRAGPVGEVLPDSVWEDLDGTKLEAAASEAASEEDKKLQEKMMKEESKRKSGEAFARTYQDEMSRFDDNVSERMKIKTKDADGNDKVIGVRSRKEAEAEEMARILELSRSEAQIYGGGEGELSLADAKKYGTDYLRSAQSAKASPGAAGVAAPTPTTVAQAAAATAAMQENDGSRARAMRQSMGAMKGATPEEIYQKQMGDMAKGAAWEKYSPEERAKIQADAKKASQMAYVDDKMDGRKIAGVKTQTYGKEGGFTSAAQENKHEATQAQQAEWSSQQAQQGMSDVYGSEMVGGGGGGGGGVLLVKISLDKGLQEQIDKQGSFMVEVSRGAGVTAA